jgi:phosphatidylserine/phosphatidylglycerophosphate/cardiolipin synthase-like enzyme
LAFFGNRGLSAPEASSPKWNVYFSPGGGCTEAVVKALREAKTEVGVQACSFTSVPIAQALVEAHKRKVRITVVLDKKQQSDRYSSATFLANAGIVTLIDGGHAIAHNKVMVIDQHTIITGSFNFTKAAEHSNAENVLVIDDQPMASKYLQNFREHEKHARKYEGLKR